MIKGMTAKEYRKKYSKKWREENPEKVRKYYQNNREKKIEQGKKYRKKHMQDLKDQAIEIYGGKCQFQAQTITINGKEHHFKDCDDVWSGKIVPEMLQWHHKKGGGKIEHTYDVYRRIRDNGIQNDVELLCANHHLLADLRDGTKQ